MKTPEELAEEYKENNDECEFAREAYLAGYRAAQEHAHAALEEAEARIQELRDQLADVSKVIPDSCEHILNMGKMIDVSTSATLNNWISVKDRLPELNDNHYSDDVLMFNQHGMEVTHIEKVKRIIRWKGIQEVIETNNGALIEEYTHWMPLPKPPKEEG